MGKQTTEEKRAAQCVEFIRKTARGRAKKPVKMPHKDDLIEDAPEPPEKGDVDGRD